jgi:hypothetical protein
MEVSMDTNPINNQQFSDDFHRFVLQDGKLEQPRIYPTQPAPKPFDINIGKTEKSKNRKEKDKEQKKKKS